MVALHSLKMCVNCAAATAIFKTLPHCKFTQIERVYEVCFHRNDKFIMCIGIEDEVLLLLLLPRGPICTLSLTASPEIVCLHKCVINLSVTWICISFTKKTEKKNQNKSLFYVRGCDVKCIKCMHSVCQKFQFLFVRGGNVDDPMHDRA